MEREGQLYWQLVLNKVSYGLSWCLIGKESTCNAEDMALILGSGRSPREGHRNHSSTLPCISSLETQTVKRLPTMREIQAWIFFFFKPHFDLSVVILCMPLPITALGVTQFIYIWT